MGVTRRQVIIGGSAAAVLGIVGGYELVENRVLPGKTRLDRALGKCGEAPPLPTNALGPKATGSFVSQARAGKTVNWTVSYPPGQSTDAALPVVIAFPGRGGNDASVFNALNLDKFMAAEVDAGHVRPFAIASADGGASTCWHKRADGDDPAGMILDEFLPLLKARGLNTDKVGFWGQSLGGYGAVHIAMLAGPSQAAVTVGSSPALWRTFKETAYGTYDNAADFTANTVFGRQSELAGIAVRLDCGSSDPFAPNVALFRNSLTPTPAGVIAGGCHDNAFSERHLADQLKFLSDNLPA
jgi:enterochelin esterase-like enzyme